MLRVRLLLLRLLLSGCFISFSMFFLAPSLFLVLSASVSLCLPLPLSLSLSTCLSHCLNTCMSLSLFPSFCLPYPCPPYFQPPLSPVSLYLPLTVFVRKGDGSV